MSMGLRNMGLRNTETENTLVKNASRKYALSQRVRIKTSNGTHKEPPQNNKGALATIAIQSISDWLESSHIMPAETPRSYYVELEDGATILVGEDWLEVPEPELRGR